MPAQTAITTHPNKAKMTQAVAGWIAEAAGRPDADLKLIARADWLEAQINLLAEPSTPAHLDGLTVEDLHGAANELRKAARVAVVEKASMFMTGIAA